MENSILITNYRSCIIIMTREIVSEQSNNSCKKRRISHQILRTVQFMCGRSTACDERFKHGADNNAFHILGCGFVVHSSKVISKPSLVWNAKTSIKLYWVTQFREIMTQRTQELLKGHTKYKKQKMLITLGLLILMDICKWITPNLLQNLYYGASHPIFGVNISKLIRHYFYMELTVDTK